MLAWTLGIILFFFTLVYLFYAGLTVRHAARFRYLSKRTVYLTVFFLLTSLTLWSLALLIVLKTAFTL